MSGREKMIDSTEGENAVRENFVEVGGLRMRFLQAGRGPALVLVHGLLGYSFSWRKVIPILAREREVIAVDMPGSGFSECSAAIDGRLTAAAQRLSRFLEIIGAFPCDLVGSSYGGTTALRLAALEPERIRTLTLVSPANPWSRIGRKRLAALRIPAIGWLFPKIARHIHPLPRYFMARMYGDASRVSAETVEGYSLPIARHGVLEHAVKITRSWQADMEELEREMPKAAEIPTLIVWGSKDRLVDRASIEPLRKNFKTVKSVVLDGLGHLPYEEGPAQFCPPVMDFLDAHSPVQRKVT